MQHREGHRSATDASMVHGTVHHFLLIVLAPGHHHISGHTVPVLKYSWLLLLKNVVGEADEKSHSVIGYLTTYSCNKKNMPGGTAGEVITILS